MPTAEAAPSKPVQVHHPGGGGSHGSLENMPVQQVHEPTAAAAPTQDISTQAPEPTAKAAPATALVASGASTPAAALDAASASTLATAAGTVACLGNGQQCFVARCDLQGRVPECNNEPFEGQSGARALESNSP